MNDDMKEKVTGVEESESVRLEDAAQAETFSDENERTDSGASAPSAELEPSWIDEAEETASVDRSFSKVSSLLGKIRGMLSSSSSDRESDETFENIPGKLREPVPYAKALIAHHDRGGMISEEYRTLRTSLLAQCSDERFTYLVTSAEADEGKTVTCLNLALVMAERIDRRTIVVDCNLRNGRMAQLLRIESDPGMADVLRGSAALADVIRPTMYPNLFFIPAGTLGEDHAGELLSRATLKETVNDLRAEYDYVLLDAPPINGFSDAGMVGQVAGNALLVARMNKTCRDSVDRAIRLLKAASVKLSGIVLTHWKNNACYFVV